MTIINNITSIIMSIGVASTSSPRPWAGHQARAERRSTW